MTTKAATRPGSIPVGQVTEGNWYCHHCQCGWYDEDVIYEEKCPWCGSHLTGLSDMADDLGKHGYTVAKPGEVVWITDTAAAGELRCNDDDHTKLCDRELAIRDGELLGSVWRENPRTSIWTATDASGAELRTDYHEKACAAVEDIGK